MSVWIYPPTPTRHLYSGWTMGCLTISTKPSFNNDENNFWKHFSQPSHSNSNDLDLHVETKRTDKGKRKERSVQKMWLKIVSIVICKRESVRKALGYTKWTHVTIPLNTTDPYIPNKHGLHIPPIIASPPPPAPVHPRNYFLKSRSLLLFILSSSFRNRHSVFE